MATDERWVGLELPKRSALATFFQATCPGLLQKRRPRPPAPPKGQRVHELWQLDAKEKIVLGDGTIVTVLQVREPVACAFLGCFAHAVQTPSHWRKLSLEALQADLRVVFTEFGLPVGLQTDRERVYGRPATEAFPTLFTLWLVGLGIDPHCTRPGQATDQAQVERGHRTWNDGLTQPEPTPDLATYRAQLAQARYLHNEVLPSRAGDCQGRPPYQVHPEVRVPRRPYELGAELQLFNWARVDRFLARFTWPHKVSPAGQVSVGEAIYYVGQAHRGQTVTVRFAPTDRHVVFAHPQTGQELKRCPVKKLDVPTITGLEVKTVPPLSKPFQLELPL
jgi:transposase InsO family protein